MPHRARHAQIPSWACSRGRRPKITPFSREVCEHQGASGTLLSPGFWMFLMIWRSMLFSRSSVLTFCSSFTICAWQTTLTLEIIVAYLA